MPFLFRKGTAFGDCCAYSNRFARLGDVHVHDMYSVLVRTSVYPIDIPNVVAGPSTSLLQVAECLAAVHVSVSDSSHIRSTEYVV